MDDRSGPEKTAEQIEMPEHMYPNNKPRRNNTTPKAQKTAEGEYKNHDTFPCPQTPSYARANAINHAHRHGHHQEDKRLIRHLNT
jgi:hypothetical protein